MAAPGQFGTSHPLNAEFWARELQADIIDKDPLKNYTGDTPDSIIWRRRELEAGHGTQITFPLRNILKGKGFMGYGSRKEIAESLSTSYDTVRVGLIGHSTKAYGDLSDQILGVKVGNELKDGLVDWWVVQRAQNTFLQACGITGQFVDYRSGLTESVTLPGRPTEPSEFVLHNIPRAPTRILRAAGRATDEALQSTDVFSLDLIDKALPMIEESRPRMQGPYVCFLSSQQAADLTSTAGSRWEKIQLAAISARNEKSLPLYTDALGIYKDVVFIKTPYIPRGIHSTTGAVQTNTRRAVLCGRQALVVADGKDSGQGTYLRWASQVDDIGGVTYTAAWAITGMTKTQFKLDTDANSFADFGTCVLSTYATAY